MKGHHGNMFLKRATCHIVQGLRWALCENSNEASGSIKGGKFLD